MVKKGASAGDGRRYRLEDQVGHILRRAHQRATAVFQALIGDEQITPTQFAALIRLYDTGGLSQNHLGRLTAMDPATIQGVMRRLQERQLVDVQPDPKDKRRMRLTLTPAGTALAQRLVENGPKVTAAILEPLKPEEREVFLALLKRIV